MKLTNRQMDEYISALKDVSERTTGKLGYCIARNMRKLAEELIEYQELKNKAIIKYGEKNANGNTSIEIGSEAFFKYQTEMKEYMDIAHDIQLLTVTEQDVLNSDLNAKEMLSIDFMITENNENV